jgi:hypothetical protein
MNVNNILNYCRTGERGCAEKETMMAVEGTSKGGVNFHRELTAYLDSPLARRTKSGSLAPN